MRQAVIYPGKDGYWVAECPSLPGCVRQGKTKEEAVANIKGAIHGYIAALEEDHLPVPEAGVERNSVQEETESSRTCSVLFLCDTPGRRSGSFQLDPVKLSPGQ